VRKSAQEEPAPPEAGWLSRRELLETTGTALLGAAGLAVGAAAVRVAYPRATPRGAAVLGPRELGVGALLFVPEHELFLVRTPAGIGAFSASCTHLGCTVRQGGDGLVCPCHGARYDREGRVLSGPARRDLPWLRVHVGEGGVIVVERERTVETGLTTPLATETKS
jgi:cytochrome b6-f complex iron-sulfur subunit